jgi:signal transduction histidine kinase
MIAVGYFFGRQFLTRSARQRGTHALPRAAHHPRDIRTGDEFADLGDAFNMMADRLVELQENVKRQERWGMFGRLAAGLVHDLSHPIQNLGNSTRLLVPTTSTRNHAWPSAHHRTRARNAQALHGGPLLS